MYKNYPLFITIIIAYILAVAFLWLPAASPFMFFVFNDVPFCTWTCTVTDGIKFCDPREPIQPCYPYYGFRILIGAAIDTIITYVVEAIFIRKFTVKYDDRKEAQRMVKFAEEMETLVAKSELVATADSNASQPPYAL